MKFTTKAWIQTQFQNFANRISAVFAKKTEINNGTLTIQKNGTSVKTFSANQSGNVTANITVPTQASDVGAVATTQIMTTKEQISANTDVNNVVGAVAVKNMIGEVSSNLADYVYPSAYGGDANNIKTNCHKFVFNMSNLPESYGFLDVSNFDGSNFSPSSTGVIRQQFTGWNTGKNYTRCYYGSTWTSWVDLNRQITQLANDVNNLKNSRTWNVILATQEDGTYEVPTLSNNKEILLTFGYLYRIEHTMTIPSNIFVGATGEGGKILFGGLGIEVPDNTHISVSGLVTNMLFRVFVR